jgi:tetratricopeptide (TPR) repeat protein
MQVDEGNDAAIQGDFDTALNKYRAAITINVCNAFAWADMGEVFLSISDPTRARTALTAASRLMPTHYQAWTNLGRAEEQLGRRAEAASAFSRALQANPGYAPADEGLQRTGSR